MHESDTGWGQAPEGGQTVAVVYGVPAQQGRMETEKAPAGLQQAPKRKRRKLETTNIAEGSNLRRK